MYFTFLAIAAWIWFFWAGDKKRLREIYGAAIFASFLGFVTDVIMVDFKLWSYAGLPHPQYTIPLLLDFSIYPVVAYLFVQKLPVKWLGIIKRILLWTLGAGIFEWVTLKTGHMQYYKWWNLWLSIGADIIIFLLIIGVYFYYRPAYTERKI